MGNCGSHASGQNDVTEIHEQSASHHHVNKRLMESMSTPFLSGLEPRNVYPASEQYRIAFDGGSVNCMPGDENCNLSENGDCLSDIPNARSVTPTSGVRTKYNVRQLSLQGSNYHIGYRPCSSLSNDSHILPETRYGHPNCVIDSRKSSNSTSQLLKYSLNPPTVSTLSHFQAPYSASANSSLSYGHSTHTPETNSIRDQRSSPVSLQPPQRSSICIEGDFYKMKHAQNIALKYPQNSNKYLIHHSLANVTQPVSVTHADTNSEKACYPKYSARQTNGKFFIVLFDYFAHSEEDLTVHKGDSLTLLEQRYGVLFYFPLKELFVVDFSLGCSCK